MDDVRGGDTRDILYSRAGVECSSLCHGSLDWNPMLFEHHLFQLMPLHRDPSDPFCLSFFPFLALALVFFRVPDFLFKHIGNYMCIQYPHTRAGEGVMGSNNQLISTSENAYLSHNTIQHLPRTTPSFPSTYPPTLKIKYTVFLFNAYLHITRMFPFLDEVWLRGDLYKPTPSVILLPLVALFGLIVDILVLLKSCSFPSLRCVTNIALVSEVNSCYNHYTFVNNR
jgi:hypothetical protein